MFRRAWLNEYTDYRLDIPMARFDKEIHFWIGVQQRLDTWRSKDGDEPLPELFEFLDID